MDWLDLLAVQGTLKSLLQHHSSKASILQCIAFIMVQLSHPYMTTGKVITLTRWTFVSKSAGSLLTLSIKALTSCLWWGLGGVGLWMKVFIILNFSEFTLDMDKSHMELHNKLISPQTNYHWVAGELVSTRRLREKQ